MKFGTVAFLAITAIATCACNRSPEAKSARYMEMGKRFMEKHNTARAILEFRNAAQATPKDPEVYHQMALAYLADGNVRNAVVGFQKALQLNPKHTQAQLKLAQLMANADDREVLENAQQRLQSLLQDTPGSTDALHALAVTELKLGNLDHATRLLEQAMAAAPQDLTVALTLSQAKLRDNDVKGAEEVLKQTCKNFSTSADAFAILGRFYVLQNRPAEAEQQFRHALTLDSKHGGALLNLATLQYHMGRKQEAEQNLKRLYDLADKTYKTVYPSFLFQEGRRDEAVREFEKLARQDPEDRQARTRLVAAYQAMNRLPDAQKLLGDALGKNPKDVDALLQRGELFLSAGKYVEAEKDLNAVLHFRPDAAEVHYSMASLHQARGATMLQRQELNEALRVNSLFLPARLELAKSLLSEDAKAALSVLDTAPGDQKSLPALIEQRNWILLRAHNYAEVQAGVKQALARDRTVDLLLQDGILKIVNKHYPEARTSLREALAKSPEDLRVLRFLVHSYAAQNQIPAAVGEIRAHAAQYPKSPAILYFLGTLLLETGDQAQAKQTFASAKAIDAKYTPVDLALAQIDLKQANWNDARQQLNTVLAAGREDPTARMWLGMLEASSGNHAAAIAAFRRVVDLQPNNVTALNNLAYLLAENAGQADEALKYAQRAKELEPETARVDDTLGWVLYHKSVYPLAVKHLEMANAREATALREFHLAMAYLKAGDKGRGRTALKAALSMDPNLREAKQAEELFK